MARCYANENFPLPVVEVLRHFGHEVLTTAESGRAEQAIPDAAVLAFAVAEQRVMLTLNRRHFIRLHQTTPEHTGIVVCTVDPDFAASAQRIHTAWRHTPRWQDNCSVSTARRYNTSPVYPQTQLTGLPNQGVQPTARSVRRASASGSG
jgi:Domain of unknown function (DUF5615)